MVACLCFLPFSSISITEIFSVLKSLTNHILLPLMVECTVFFCAFTSVDMVTGIYAAKKVNARRNNPQPKVLIL